MSELRGKGWRVLGYFIWMVGAGVVLDSDAIGFGTALLLTGGCLFAVGLASAQRPATHEVASAQRPATHEAKEPLA
jgi:hypothetical protein